MSDEVTSAALSSSQKAIEVTAELIKLLAPLAKSLLEEVYHKSVDGINNVGSKIVNAHSAGTVSNKGLIAEAQKAGSPISTTSNFLARDAELVAAKAKEYKIPVAIVGNGEKQTIEFLDRDKGIIEQITNEIMQERLKGAPETIKCFSVGENNVSSMKALFEENGIECQFIKGTNGKISCIYPAENSEQVAVLKSDYKVAHTNVEMNCKFTPDIPENESQIAIKSQIEQLENSLGNSEARGIFYAEISADESIGFPEYSEKNMERVYEEMPDAVKVAGKAFWEKQGYTVSENAKGIEITAPQLDDNGDPVLDGNGKQIFTSATVYDISETNAFEKTIKQKIADLEHDYDAEKINAFSEAENKTVFISDELSGKRAEINFDSKLRKADVAEIMRNELGYSTVQADIAANKFCYDLGLNKERYFAAPTQLDNIDALKTNIRYESDDLTIRDIRYDAVNFKDGEDTHLIIQNGDKAVGLTPAKMSETEMKDICVNQLGLTQYQAEKAVGKAIKIDKQVRSQMEERTVDKRGISEELRIERTSDNTFTVSSRNKLKVYNFSTINIEEKIADHFNIPKENARNIVEKAKKQSVLQNKIQNAAKKKKTSKTAETPKITASKGLKH
ncbi:MAG: hypothetical protein HDT43_00120 [Ruminococcaceae bacterium]|nr:hypothetical protein [Oscillospiraceae bacterium]